ncbi:hypothetical protein G0U57_004112, partial [Chelydra serpentina]
MLINVWSDCTVFHDFSQSGRNIHLYWEISWRLKQAGIERTPAQGREHMNQMRLPYRRAKDSNSLSGKASCTFPFYEELDQVLSRAPGTEPEVV